MNVDTATLVSVIGAAITVGTVLFRTGKLAASIEHLVEAVKSLETHRNDVDERLGRHEQRLSVLEDRAGIRMKSPIADEMTTQRRERGK